MWADNSVFYQIYPLGFCGAPEDNDGKVVPRILKVKEWTDYIQWLGITAVYFSPVFQSDRHGYDTQDYKTIDCRLGTNKDFAEVCDDLHKHGIRIILDGVFNHVGRGFWAFQDVLKNREHSQYRDWFYLNFNLNNSYNDGLFYEGWEGHYELVKLNLSNSDVKEHIFSCIRLWVEEFHIDGLRLDVAYCIDKHFLMQLRAYCNGLKSEFLLLGEILFGDYNQIVNDNMCNSCTNYECYKGLYSSFNDLNMFEIDYSLNRQFGAESWTLYNGKHLLAFADNHDVTRLASILKEKRHLPLVYGMLFGIPGIPCIYYGSEWGAEGIKENGSDAGLRPCFNSPQKNGLTKMIATLTRIHAESKALCFGGYRSLVLTNRQLVFERSHEEEKIIIAVNADDKNYHAHFNIGEQQAIDLFTGEAANLKGGYDLLPYSLSYWKIE